MQSVVRWSRGRDGNLRQAFESGGTLSQSYRARAAAEKMAQFWALSQHCTQAIRFVRVYAERFLVV